MALRRMNRRRNAGAPTRGALLINPRRRKKTTRKRKTTKRKKNTTTRMSAAKRRAAAKKAAATRKRNALARSRAAKKAAATRKRNGTHKGMRRKTARRAYMKNRRRNTRRNPVHKRKANRRRNTGALAGLQSSVKKVPVVGGMLGDIVGLGVPAAFGAVSILPIEMALKAGGRFLPPMLQQISFTVGGLVMGALAKRFLPASPSMRDKIAIALATAGGAVDFYRYRTGQGTVASMEAAEAAGFGAQLGELELMDGFGELEVMDGFGELEVMDGFGELEVMNGYGAYGDMEYDIANFPEALGWAGACSLGDAAFAGSDMTALERSAALAGPGRFKAQFVSPRMRTQLRARSTPAGAPSPAAGQPGVRWGWLVKLIGSKQFAKVAALPADKRQAVIASLKATATSQVPSLIEEQTAAGKGSTAGTAGFGAQLYAL